MIKKKNIIIILTIIMALLVASILVAQSSNSWFLLGNNISKLKNDSTVVVAKVGDMEITKRDVKTQMLFKKFQNDILNENTSELQSNNNTLSTQSVTKEDVLNDLINNDILYEEAQKEGLSISYDEAKKFMENTRDTMNAIISGKLKCANQKEAIDDINNFKEYIKGLGMSEDEYWNQSIKDYQRVLTVAKLKNKIISTMPENDRKDIDKINKYFDQYKNTLRNSYKVEIFDNNL